MEEKDIPGQEEAEAQAEAASKEETASVMEGQAETETAAVGKAPAEAGAESDAEKGIDESKYSTFIIKLFPEIVVKSKPVRTRMIRILTGNIRNVFQNSGIRVKVLGNWDRVFVKVPKEVSNETSSDILSRIPGIHSFSEVLSFPYASLEDILRTAAPLALPEITGKTFCVRCKRKGQETFTSVELERALGEVLWESGKSAGVSLKKPQITIHIEVDGKKFYLLSNTRKGIGGYPLSTQEDVLSLISGGFDSGVSSFDFIRRGARVHYCFFNMGGREHEIGVREETGKTGYTLFELNACSRCGVCISGCPIDRVLENHEIQSVYLIRSLRNQERGSRLKMIADNCLMCDRCTVDCPVGIDLSALRRQTRAKGAIDTTGNYTYLNKRQTPFNAIGRVAYFGGCMSHLTPGITESMEKIFTAAGQKYWYMDKLGTICCGRPLQQQGFTNQAAELRQKNTDLIKKSGATMLVTSCPICYQSFKKEYNLDIPVVHHTEYIDMLIKQGRLKVRHDDRKVSYHDPCELGRGCGIYEEPRQVLSAVTNLQKTRYQREKSVCCGFNLGDTKLSIEEQTKIRNASLANLTSKPVDAIATACPMCKKAFQHATNDYPVRDIAEIVAENLID